MHKKRAGIKMQPRFKIQYPMKNLTAKYSAHRSDLIQPIRTAYFMY
jgi:hypothetical protein